MSAELISWSLRQVARFARAFAWIAVAGVALMAVLVALPSIVDTEAYKPRVAEILASASGRTVSLDGPLSFELLPQPRLVLRDVRVGNVPGAATPTMLTARRLAVRLSWQALLQGRIEILRVALDEPRLVLEPGADGRPNWWFPILESARGERPPLLPVTLDRVEIRGGRLVNATGLVGQPIEAHAIDLVATLDAARGRVKVEGAAIFNGLPSTFALGLDTAGSAGPPVDLIIGLPGGRMNFRGWPGHRSDDDPLRGHLAVEASFLPEFVESMSLVLGRSPLRVNEAVLKRVEASGDVLLEQALALIGPLARLLVANGVGYTQLAARLKPVFMAAAQAELQASDKKTTDAAISLLSGVHRKDVRAWTDARATPDAVGALQAVGTRDVEFRCRL